MTYELMPVWAQSGLVLLALGLAAMFGVYLRCRLPAATSGDATHLLSAVLGLLALLIGFTFSLALNRYDLRRDLVVREANAIGTLYLRTDLAPEPYRARLQVLTRRYADSRLALAAAGEDQKAVAAAEQASAGLQTELWSATMAATPDMNTPLAGLLIGALNETIDLSATRKAALSAHLPQSVVMVLILYALIAAAFVAYVDGGKEWRPRPGTLVLLVLLNLAILLIFDLDRPRTGSIIISQAPLTDLKTAIAGPR